MEILGIFVELVVSFRKNPQLCTFLIAIDMINYFVGTELLDLSSFIICIKATCTILVAAYFVLFFLFIPIIKV